MKKVKTTTNYILAFSGWAQCRMATDPDPTNDPRGVSGYSFAVPGEPDFDRILYFQNRKGVVHRSFGPKVGVHVKSGFEYHTTGSGGEERFVSKTEINSKHPLFHAEVDLLKNPVFDSRNGTVIFNGFGVVNPFILSILGKNKMSIQRRFYADPDNPQNDLQKYSIDTLTPYAMGTAIMNSPNMIQLADVLQRSAFRNERLDNLKKELAKTENPTQIAALKKRITELEINDPNNRRTNQIGTKVLLNYPLNSKNALYNGKKIKPKEDWQLEIWMGGWDTDSLCFWVEGNVQIAI